MNFVNKGLFLVLSAALALSGCGRKAEEAKVGKPPVGTLITVVQAKSETVRVTEKSVGEVTSETAPVVAAEVSGRVMKVLVDAGEAVKAGQVLAELDRQDRMIDQRAAAAEVSRLKALLANQELVHERNRKLRQQTFISQAALDSSESQLTAIREQLAAAREQLAGAGRALGKASVVAPVAGIIDQRRISAGDFVDVGTPLFKISTSQELRVTLPFPEGVAPRLRPGLEVRLTTPTAPDKAVSGKIGEIRPIVGSANRAVEVIVSVSNPGGWSPGASVNGEVVIEEHPGAVVVPENSVVLRPAGKVVYLVKDGRAVQQVVPTGVSRGGFVEILSGLKAGDTVAADGAGYLSDQAPVTVQGANQRAGK